jgi:hypothetical protein
MTIERPDPAKVMAKLKDFQRATAEYAFRRMYLDDDHTTRFLVADEVGLGKTLVAKGIIAKTIDRLWKQTDRIDIIYICSNSAIARQNINRLNVTQGHQHTVASRITMLPVEVRDLNSRRLNFVSLTPATSFDPQSSMGMARERALLYHLLDRAWSLKGAAPYNVLEGTSGSDAFRRQVDWFPAEEIDDKVAAEFATALAGRPEYRTRFDQACGFFARSGIRSNRPQEARDLQRQVIGELRSLLAQTCLRSLEPDLIILDEFQRFKHLLDANNEEAELAHDLFNYVDHNEAKARVLLLSATPYKMYTQADEADGEDHYQDFIATLAFLQHDPARTEATRALLSEYRREWLRLGQGDNPRLRELKLELERELKRVIVRTERLAATPDRDGMLVAKPIPGLGLDPKEALAYRTLGQLADLVEHGDPIEYWKGAPYLLSFMETRQYKLKREIEEAAQDSERAGNVAKLIDRRLPLVLPWDAIVRYEKIDPGNARMRWLVDRTVSSGAWRLLWVPPANPWYQLAGPYADPALADFTKTLVFSGWQVVPKAIAAIVSYAAEREMMLLGGQSDNTEEARKKISRPLRFGQASGSSLFLLVYPSPVLAQIAMEVRSELPAGATVDDAVGAAERRIAERLARLPNPKRAGRVDEEWYWAGPALLDSLEAHGQTEAWFRNKDLALEWLAGDPEDTPDMPGGTRAEQRNLDQLHHHVMQRGSDLGPRPHDLARVLAEAVLGSPAVAALAGLTSVLGQGARWSPEVRNTAGRIGWGFRGYFNLPEIYMMVRGQPTETPYWQLVLRYGVNGGIGAVMEEYIHILREGVGVSDHPLVEAAVAIGKEVVTAVGLRTASMRADDVVDRSRIRVSFQSRSLRSRYAVRLVGDDEEEGGVLNRMDVVRAAFNSPFLPFVLATTSIGQEGLDFHSYCHAVVHWNPPSNPVDLEQREGRVHRYKGHAVRRNVARLHGGNGSNRANDPWQALFSAASDDRPARGSEIWPYWIYPTDRGAKIERYVPGMPLSRDEVRYARVRQSAALYRAVIGQSRQEDLLQVLAKWDTAKMIEFSRYSVELGPHLESGQP